MKVSMLSSMPAAFWAAEPTTAIAVGVHGVAAGHLALLDDAHCGTGFGGLIGGGQSGIA